MHDFFSENTVTGKPLEILVVEDSVSHAKLTLSALERLPFPHRVSLVRDGASALDFLRQEGLYRRAPRPELLLLDLGLPGVTGQDVLDLVSAAPELADLPVIVVTGEEDAAILEGRPCVRRLLKKPVQVEEVLEIVREIRKEVRHQERFGSLHLVG